MVAVSFVSPVYAASSTKARKGSEARQQEAKKKPKGGC
jgi:hypothetical protein